MSSPHIPPSSHPDPPPNLAYPTGCFSVSLGYLETPTEVTQSCYVGRDLWFPKTSLRTRTTSGSLLYPQKLAQGLAYRTPSIYIERVNLIVFGNSIVHLSYLLSFLVFHLPPHCSSLLDSVFLPAPQIRLFPRVLKSALLHSLFVLSPTEIHPHQHRRTSRYFRQLFSLGHKFNTPAKIPITWGLLQEVKPCQKKLIPVKRNKGQRGIGPSQWGQLSLKWDWQAGLCHQTVTKVSYINDKEASFLRDRYCLSKSRLSEARGLYTFKGTSCPSLKTVFHIKQKGLLQYFITNECNGENGPTLLLQLAKPAL